jgi:hypothetical protein
MPKPKIITARAIMTEHSLTAMFSCSSKVVLIRYKPIISTRIPRMNIGMPRFMRVKWV